MSAPVILSASFGADDLSVTGRLRPVRGPATRMGSVGQEEPLTLGPQFS
jgi:hypothetical protein